MAITLAFTDAQDGTGGDAVISGSAVGSSNQVLAQAIDPTGQTTPTFAPAGSRTGDGTVSLALASGVWWLVVQSTVGPAVTLSNILYAPVTDSEDAVASRCADALAARLATIPMATDVGVSVPSGRIFKSVVQQFDLMTLPCILLSWDNTADSQAGGVFGKEKILHAVNVSVFDRADAATPAKRLTWLKWQEQVFKSLRTRKLDGVPELVWTLCAPKQTFDPKLPQYQTLLIGFAVRFYCYELR